MRRLLSKLVVVLFFFGFFGGISWAQTTGSIAGTIQDTSGAVIPEVTVTVRNVETGTVRTVTTDDRGYYQVLSLQVGQYEISAEASGFKKALRKGVDLTVGQQAVIAFSLEVGQVQQEVTVTAEVPVIDATTYGVEYGKRSGGQVNIVTQSGTNLFHGTAFEFLRNDALDATDFITNAAGGTKPAFRRNDFGAAAGGPIRKDKTFIFGNYEGYRQTLTQTNLAIVPNDNARRGLLPIGPRGPLVQVGVTPGVAPYFPMYPRAN